MVRSRAPNPYAELDDDSQWWVPEQLPIDGDPAAASVGVAEDGGSLLTQEQVARFHRTGFLVVNGLWPDELVRAAGAEMEQLLPPHTDAAAEGPIPGSDGLIVIPCTGRGEASPDMALNQLPVCPRALGVVSQLLQAPEDELRLSQCHVSIKHGRTASTAGDGPEPELSGDQGVSLLPTRVRPLPLPPVLCLTQLLRCVRASRCRYASGYVGQHAAGARTIAAPRACSSVLLQRCGGMRRSYSPCAHATWRSGDNDRSDRREQC